jgi:hypothetical protein
MKSIKKFKVIARWPDESTVEESFLRKIDAVNFKLKCVNTGAVVTIEDK